jgi:nondiscriminating aspartyl-tRNA synthetase
MIPSFPIDVVPSLDVDVERRPAAELASGVDRVVRLSGWMHHRRKLAQVTFVLLRDASGIAQVVIEDAGLRRQVASLPLETVLDVVGVSRRSDQAPRGVELHASAIRTMSTSTGPPPVNITRTHVEAHLPATLDHAAVTLRHPRRQAIARLAAASVAGFRAGLDRLGFIEIHTPKLVASATETGANVFPVDYFGSTAFLAQSPQFYKQIMVGSLERVYEIGPVFRAEPHDTTRHLATYTSLDAELGFITDHTTVMTVLSAVLESMRSTITERAAADLAVLGIDLPQLPPRIPTIHFTDALQLIQTLGGGQRNEDVLDLNPHDERLLGRWALDERDSDFLYVVGYPSAKRPFYTHPDPTRPGYTNSFDLLLKGIELVTGGQRLHHHRDYIEALPKDQHATLSGYLAAFAHGMPPHGGFAIGLERWTAGIVGASNIRETTLFPRDIHRLTP